MDKRELWHETAEKLGIQELIPVICKIRHDHENLETRFKEAFPNGDHSGHCFAHRIMMEDLLAKRQLIKTIKERTFAGLIWLLILGIGSLIWQGLSTKMGIK